MLFIEEVLVWSIELFCSVYGNFLQIAVWVFFFVTYFTFLALSLAITKPGGDSASCHNSDNTDRIRRDFF